MLTPWKKIENFQKIVLRRTARGSNHRHDQQQHLLINSIIGYGPTSCSRSLSTYFCLVTARGSHRNGVNPVTVTSVGINYFVRQFHSVSTSSNSTTSDLKAVSNSRPNSQSSTFNMWSDGILNSPLWLIPRKGTGT
jgi:hypothetical protein